MNKPEPPCPPYCADYALIRQRRLLEIVPFSASTLHRLIRANKFPRQKKLAERVSAWSAAEVYEWLEAKGGVR